MPEIEIGHGSGGRLTRELIEKVFLKYLTCDELSPLEDASYIELSQNHTAYTTDSYVIRPLFFPGGDIGKLSVCGTVNDLSVSGAVPKYLSAGFILEEGFPIEDLEKILQSMGMASKKAGIKIVAGDTKVVEKNKCDGLYINTTGVGEVACTMTPGDVTQGDVVIVTGTIGDHGTAVAIAREEFDLDAPVESDCAPLNGLLAPLFEIEGLKWMRDPTRGGLATALAELSDSAGLGVEVYEDSIPVREDVRFISDMLGYDPIYMANEGKAVIVASRGSEERILETLREHPLGRNTALIGEITDRFHGVRLTTRIGGERILDFLEEDLLPRIC